MASLLALLPAWAPLWLPLVGAALAVALLVVVAVCGYYVSVELARPPPKEGTPFKLPNGVTILHWNAMETNFLYEEIFGAESPYNRGGQLQFAPGQTIVDAGANIGMFTLFAAKATQGHARIVSFEPIPTTYAVLARNARAAAAGAYKGWFGAAPTAVLDLAPQQLGLSDVAADVTFEHSPHLSIWSAKDIEFVEDRKRRFATDIERAIDTSPNLLVRWCFPRFLSKWLTLRFIAKLAATQPVAAKLVTLSSMIDKLDLRVIDLLKVDVEGSEEAVLRGIQARHWPRIQQLVLEVENFATVAAITAQLETRGFEVRSYATEREKNPAATSQVSMMYAVRPGYAPGAPVLGGSEASEARGRQAGAGANSSPAAKARSTSKPVPAARRAAGRGRGDAR